MKDTHLWNDVCAKRKQVHCTVFFRSPYQIQKLYNHSCFSHCFQKTISYSVIFSNYHLWKAMEIRTGLWQMKKDKCFTQFKRGQGEDPEDLISIISVPYEFTSTAGQEDEGSGHKEKQLRLIAKIKFFPLRKDRQWHSMARRVCRLHLRRFSRLNLLAWRTDQTLLTFLWPYPPEVSSNLNYPLFLWF